jgi:hypothetical protein
MSAPERERVRDKRMWVRERERVFKKGESYLGRNEDVDVKRGGGRAIESHGIGAW